MTVYSLYVPSKEVEIDALCRRLTDEKRLSEYLIKLVRRDAKTVILANLERSKGDVAFWEGLLENGRDIEGVTDRVEHEKTLALEKLAEMWVAGNRDELDDKSNFSWLEAHGDKVTLAFGNLNVDYSEVIGKIKEVIKENEGKGN